MIYSFRVDLIVYSPKDLRAISRKIATEVWYCHSSVALLQIISLQFHEVMRMLTNFFKSNCPYLSLFHLRQNS